MIILYNVSSNWLRKSRDRAKKTSSLRGNTYCVSPLQKSRDFFSKCMNKPIGAYDVNRDDQIINIFKLNDLNSLIFTIVDSNLSKKKR